VAVIPAPVAGAAILTLVWLALWSVVGVGRHVPLGRLGSWATAISFGVLALSDASRQRLLWSVAFLLCAGFWARHAEQLFWQRPVRTNTLDREPADG
jgi:hypothetical protein